MRTLLVLAAALLAACGDKVPQAEASRKLGDQPKQAVDKAVVDTTKALQQGADRATDADKKP